ncbi:MAG: ATP-grasp fold amidoligase family protein [Thermovirgaceae bacterium]
MALLETAREQFRFFKTQRKFYKRHGYFANLQDPRLYSEKIFWRKVYDRNPLFPEMVDKYRSREYVTKRLGPETARRILVPLLFATQKPEDIPFESFSEPYIVKPNHGSGWLIIAEDPARANSKEIIQRCRKWLGTTYGQEEMEWAYSKIKPLIMVELLLKDSQGKPASDYKFHVFHGEVKWVFVMHDRFGNRSFSRYDKFFYPLAPYPKGEKTHKPKNYEEMVKMAETLSSSLDYVRVDMYNIEGNIFFGEFTLYPASGLQKLFSLEVERQRGALWNLSHEHMREFRPWFPKWHKSDFPGKSVL